jgi:CRISPR-associated protein (TIGR03986 family)
MPGQPNKQHRIRVKTLDGKPRDQSALNKLRSNQLGMPYLDIVGTDVPHEFIICASKDGQIEQVRAKLAGAGLEEVEGDTAVAVRTAPQSANSKGSRPRHSAHWGDDRRGGRGGYGGSQPSGPGGHHGGGSGLTPETDKADLNKKPYGFVSLPEKLTAAAPVWHDGTCSEGRLSGEVRFEIEALTPLLVGWERGLLGDDEHCDWPIESMAEGQEQRWMNLDDQWIGPMVANKSVLCPLRAPWGERPVVIPGDSLKGLLRHELGALLGAPMERVAERSYSYRPNALFPNKPGARLVARLARVPDDGVETMSLGGSSDAHVRVPTQLDLFPADLEYNKRAEKFDFIFDRAGGYVYRGGLGAGKDLNTKRKLHHSLTVLRNASTEQANVSEPVQDGYLATLRHLVDLDHGHFSERHPDVPTTVSADAARSRILEAAKDEVFQPGDLVWVEWDTQKKCIVSLGWHYYYRWAYTDSVRKDANAPTLERHGLFPLDTERKYDADGAPAGLSAVRHLFGYTGDNEGSAGIGENDHAQLMGRLFPNAAVEVVKSGDTVESRFLKPTFLKELGMPRPSAVEHYLKQPHHPQSRPSDQAKLVTYGDAAGYDKGGELAGRKFYLDRPNAVAEDASDTNRQNERSTLALEASKPGRKFRFTVRFRDLDAAELAAVLVALSPDQFKTALGGTHTDGYCSKLGYARPLGWGSVRIEAKQLLLLDEGGDAPTLNPETDLAAWVRRNHQKTSTQDEWLAIHRRNHPDAADYPRLRGRDGQENIYTFHSKLRTEHSRARRYNRGTHDNATYPNRGPERRTARH